MVCMQNAAKPPIRRGRRPKESDPLKGGFESFAVVLVSPVYGGNIGGVARVMKNFGFTKLWLVAAPPEDAEARRRSMHALDILKNAKRFNTLTEVRKQADFLVATSAIVGTDANALRTPIYPENLTSAVESKGTIAIVFGREESGLSNEELELCDLLVTIPAHPQYSTLNLAQAVAVILYEVSRLKNKKILSSQNKMRELSLEQKEFLLKKYDDLVDSVTEGEYQRKLAKKTFRHVLGRAFVSGKEASTLIGVFRRGVEKKRV
ncbi:tRNA (cytidine(34)-2'-O)-methyltransferase [uncultured archaeon]|nr:tRNA (cytidine(34)-2'-O)-methyltransferase [uncultured archaeon]